MKVSNESDRANVIARITAIKLDKPWNISAEPCSPDRSLAQNRLSFKWYGEIGKHTGHGVEHERNYCKFHYGCQIVAAMDNQKDFAEFYTKLINTYDYEECLKAMEFIQVTSHMKVKPFVEYLNHIEQHGVEVGCRVSHPEDIYFEAMGRK